MNETLISVVMPTYNRGYIIEKAIKSVIKQTYSAWELIIVDDASNDDTEKIVKNIKDSRIHYIKNKKNMGANYSRNLGCKIAKGDYFAFLDSDNYWTIQKLEKQINILNNEAAFVFCRVELKNDTTQIFPPDDFDIDRLNEILCVNNIIDTSTVLIKRSVFEEIGGFDNDMPRYQDWEIFFRIVVVHRYSVKYIHEVLNYNVVQPNSITQDERKHIDAMLVFLEKYIDYINVDAIIQHMWILIIKGMNEDDIAKLKKIVKNSNKECGLDIIYVLLDMINHQTAYYETLLKWKEKIEQCSDRTIFSKYKNTRRKIAIYGLGKWGEMIYEEMSRQGIEILYGIDQQKESFHNLSVVKPSEIPTDIDVIIVSIFQQYEKIYDMLSKRFSGEIISIKEIINY